MNRTATIGVTGTTRGGTPEQLTTVNRLLAEFAADELRHGDCVGIDEQVAELARKLGYRIVVHPAAEEDGRAYTSCDELLPPRESAARNRDIVEASAILIGCPAADQEWPGSGTWYTINYARSRGVPVLIVSPSGRVLDDTRPHQLSPELVQSTDQAWHWLFLAVAALITAALATGAVR